MKKTITNTLYVEVNFEPPQIALLTTANCFTYLIEIDSNDYLICIYYFIYYATQLHICCRRSYLRFRASHFLNT